MLGLGWAKKKVKSVAKVVGKPLLAAGVAAVTGGTSVALAAASTAGGAVLNAAFDKGKKSLAEQPIRFPDANGTPLDTSDRRYIIAPNTAEEERAAVEAIENVNQPTGAGGDFWQTIKDNATPIAVVTGVVTALFSVVRMGRK